MTSKVCETIVMGAAAGALTLIMSLTAPAVAATASEKAAARDYEAEFDPCQDLTPSDPLNRLAQVLVRPESIRKKHVFGGNFSYTRGKSSFLPADASWTFRQAVPGYVDMNALLVYRTNGDITQSEGAAAAARLPSLRFDENKPHRLLVGLNFQGSDYVAAELTFERCVSIDTVQLTWFAVDLSRSEALGLLTNPDGIFDHPDRKEDPPSPYDDIIEDPLRMRAQLAYLTKLILELWENPQAFMDELDPIGN